MNYYLIGIKGSGMSALAKILFDKGHFVGGCDYDTHYFTEANLSFCEIHSLDDDYEGYDIYIVGSAFVGSQIHLSLLEKKYKVYRYNEFIGQMDGIGIAIAGTHGKTTTTSLIAKMFEHEKVDYLIGDGTGHGHPDNDYFIYEACEYKKHFLAYYPHFLVITNIEYEHTDFYHSLDEVIEAFKSLVSQSNICLINGDNESCKKIDGYNVLRFGFNEDNDYVIKVIDESYPYRIKITHDLISSYYTIPFYGKYMIYNCCAAIITAELNNLGNPQSAIDCFKLPKRRMTEYKKGDYIIIDDYAHHPTEILVTLEAIKEKYQREIVLVFEPHTYSRTLDLEDDYISVLNGVEHLYIADVFQSVRENRKGSVDFLLDKLPHALYFNSVVPLKKYKNEVIVFMGAGTIYENINELLSIIDDLT